MRHMYNLFTLRTPAKPFIIVSCDVIYITLHKSSFMLSLNSHVFNDTYFNEWKF